MCFLTNTLMTRVLPGEPSTPFSRPIPLFFEHDRGISLVANLTAREESLVVERHDQPEESSNVAVLSHAHH